MSESDPIVDEVRRIRDANAAKFNYDPDAIFRDIKEREKQSGRKYVSFAGRHGCRQASRRSRLGGAIAVSPDSTSREAAAAAEL